MSYLVTACDTCRTVALTAVPRPGMQLRGCDTCRQPPRVVPARLFREDERALFRELSAAVAQSNVSSSDAHGLSRFVARALCERNYVPHWEELTRRLPTLLTYAQVLGGNARAHARALQLLQAIFEAMATSQRGFVPSAGPRGASRQLA